MAIKELAAGWNGRVKNCCNQVRQHYSDAELLAIFLRTGVTGISAVDLARKLLGCFGGLRALFEADLHSFCQQAWFGYSQVCAVCSRALEISRRIWESTLTRGNGLLLMRQPTALSATSVTPLSP